jgi:hypothetical protein
LDCKKSPFCYRIFQAYPIHIVSSNMKRRLNTKSQCVQNVETKTDILHARLNFLKNENNDIDNKTKSRNKMKFKTYRY